MADLERLAENLRAFGYDVSVFERGEDAAEYIKESVKGKTVGAGGSVTFQKLGLYETLSRENDVYWHWKERDGMSHKDILKAEQVAQVYFSSVNAITEGGVIVNIDGTCNRVSAISFGHEKVYLLVGKNKIAPDLDAAIYRARNVAAPKNAQRLGRNTPCAKNADRCYDCSSPDRICKEMSILLKKPTAQSMEVVLINEDLGY